jgi:hypothetical protein
MCRYTRWHWGRKLFKQFLFKYILYGPIRTSKNSTKAKYRRYKELSAIFDEEFPQVWDFILKVKAPAVVVQPTTERIINSSSLSGGIFCPNCNAPDVQKVSVIWQAGTSTSVSRTSGSSVTMAGGRLIPTLGTATTQGVQQTHLAARFTPPQPEGWAVVGIIGGLLFIILSIWMINTNSHIIGLLICGIGVFIFGCKAQVYNTRKYPAALETWQKSWFCSRCGKVFIR